jgi:hypothetical protein
MFYHIHRVDVMCLASACLDSSAVASSSLEDDPCFKLCQISPGCVDSISNMGICPGFFASDKDSYEYKYCLPESGHDCEGSRIPLSVKRAKMIVFAHKCDELCNILEVEKPCSGGQSEHGTCTHFFSKYLLTGWN